MNTELTKLLRPHILEIVPYQSARQEFVNDGRSMTLLDANENPFDSGVNRYPDPFQWDLKRAIAKHKNVQPDQLFLSNGSDELISQLIQLFCNPSKDAVLIAPPTFGMYAVAASIHDVAVKKVPLTRDFQLDVDGLLAAADSATKLLFIPTPNNPTGQHFSKEKLRKLAENFSGILVVDEAYIEFSEEPSMIPWINEFPRLVVCQTFSKAKGMAGIRLGMAFAQPDLIACLNRIKFPYNINVLTQQSALAVLEDQQRISDEITTLLHEKERLKKALIDCSFVQKCYPSDANFFLIRVDDAQKRYQEFLKAGIVVRNTSKYLYCENTLRITVGTPEENHALLTLLKK